jgi:hypothetical protein
MFYKSLSFLHMITYLKNQVQQRIRLSIDSTADCKQLIDAIYEETGELLGTNTIRRLFGLLPGRQPRLSTLHILARYLGYDSYEDFKKVQSRQDVLHTYAMLVGTGNTLPFNSLMAGIQDYRHFILLSRELLLTRQIANFLMLLESDLCPQMLSNYDRMILMGNLCGPAIATTPFTDEELTQMVQHERFMDNVIYTYVDYGALNGYFGRINDIAIQQEVRNTPFHYCLDDFIGYLNGLELSYDPFKLEVSLANHPILNSRIIATRLLYAHQYDSGHFQRIVDNYAAYLDQEQSNVMEAWFEVKLIAVIIDQPALYEALLDHLYVSEMAQNFHWTHYQLHLLFKTYNYLHQQEDKLAEQTLDGIEPERIYAPYRPITNLLIKLASDRLGLYRPELDTYTFAHYPRLKLERKRAG